MSVFHQLFVVLRVPIGSLLLILFTVLSAPAKRPNILLIMADDVGLADDLRHAHAVLHHISHQLNSGKSARS